MRLPVVDIPASQYDAFRREIGQDLPINHDQWIEREREHANELTNNGDQPVSVSVDFTEYVRFCKLNNVTPSRATLYRYAREKVA